MQFLVVVRRRTETFSPEQFAPLLDAEAAGVRSLYQEGFVRQVWGREDEPGAVLLIEAADKQEVESRLAKLPLYAADMLEVQLLTPMIPYRGIKP